MTAQDVVKHAAESSPPATYVVLRLLGIPLPDWVALLTLVYLVLQIAYLIWKWRRQVKIHGGSGDA